MDDDLQEKGIESRGWIHGFWSSGLRAEAKEDW